jgi:hypothetical protein
MNKKDWKAIELQISKYHARLYHILNNKTWVNPFGALTDKEKIEEKSYQHGWSDVKRPLGVHRASQLFAIQHVFEGLKSNLDVNSFLHIRTECYIGQAIANEYRKEIENEFSQEEIDWFLKNVDYANLQEWFED